MGLSGNALDYNYRSLDQIPRILGEFATLCIDAANVNPKYCPLASASMKAKSPASNILNRINNIITSLTQRSGYANERNTQQVFTLEGLLYDTLSAFTAPFNMPS